MSAPAVVEADKSPTAKRRRQPRPLLTQAHMSVLITSYKAHYSEYIQGKDSVVQLIPSSVWKEVYQDFTDLYPDAASFDNDHLKSRLRAALKEIEHTEANGNNVDEVMAQNELVLKRLKNSNASILMQQVMWGNHATSQANSMIGKKSAAAGVGERPKDPSCSNAAQPSPHVAPRQDRPLPQIESEPDASSRLYNDSVAGEQRESLAVPVNSADGATGSAPIVSELALLQMQASALHKISTDFGHLTSGLTEFLVVQTAKTKQVQVREALGNLEKACGMRVISFEEMKAKSRLLLQFTD